MSAVCKPFEINCAGAASVRVVLATRPPCSTCSSMKRARVQQANPYASVAAHEAVSSSCSAPHEVAEIRKQAGADLRRMIISKFAGGELTAGDACRFSYLHTRSGGCGLEDLSFDTSDAVKAKNASRHLEAVLRKEYCSPELYYVTAPGYNKRESRHCQLSVPLSLPHELLRRLGPIGPPDSNQNREGQYCWHKAYSDHPVVLECKANRVVESAILPLALYFDGVQYNKKDTVQAFYIHDMKRNRRHLVCVARPDLNFCNFKSILELSVCGFWQRFARFSFKGRATTLNPTLRQT